MLCLHGEPAQNNSIIINQGRQLQETCWRHARVKTKKFAPLSSTSSQTAAIVESTQKIITVSRGVQPCLAPRVVCRGTAKPARLSSSQYHCSVQHLLHGSFNAPCLVSSLPCPTKCQEISDRRTELCYSYTALESSDQHFYLEYLFIFLFTVALQLVMKTCALQSLGSGTRCVLAVLTVQMQIKREERS